VLSIFIGVQPLNQQSLSPFLWSVAYLLRGNYHPSDYGNCQSRHRPCCKNAAHPSSLPPSRARLTYPTTPSTNWK
jgi:hypothetical protein